MVGFYLKTPTMSNCFLSINPLFMKWFLFYAQFKRTTSCKLFLVFSHGVPRSIWDFSKSSREREGKERSFPKTFQPCVWMCKNSTYCLRCVVKHCSKNNAFMLINLAFFFNGTFASKQINPELTRVFGNRWSESWVF